MALNTIRIIWSICLKFVILFIFSGDVFKRCLGRTGGRQIRFNTYAWCSFLMCFLNISHVLETASQEMSSYLSSAELSSRSINVSAGFEIETDVPGFSFDNVYDMCLRFKNISQLLKLSFCNIHIRCATAFLLWSGGRAPTGGWRPPSRSPSCQPPNVQG